MLSNPLRPELNDIIDEAWGDQVADMIVRRYVDTAARDSDLAAFPATELAGQVVAIVPAPPGVPYLQQHNGVGWANLVSGLPAPLLAADPTQTFTDPTGEIWIARGDVAAGAWRRARDVVRALMFRTAGWAIPAASAIVPWDSYGYTDEYHLWSADNNYAFVAPCDGFYACDAMGGPMTSDGTMTNRISLEFFISGNTIGHYPQFPNNPPTWGFNAHIHRVLPLRAGNRVSVSAKTDKDLFMSVGNALVNHFEINLVQVGYLPPGAGESEQGEQQ